MNLMHFKAKSILKNNYYPTSKHPRIRDITTKKEKDER
jgi:hypothetical protein